MPRHLNEKREQARRLQVVAERFGVDLKAASLQLVLVTWPERISENVTLFNASISADFRKTLKEEELLTEYTPVPV